MSYDVQIGDIWINHTYNGCEMCEEILGFTPKDFDSKIASDVLLLVLKVRNELKTNGKNYEHYMPENKWGTIESWISFMESIIKACSTNLNEIVKVD